MRSSLVLPSLFLSLPLLTLASPTPQEAAVYDDPPISQESAEAEIRAQWEGQEAAIAAYESIPYVTSISPEQAAEESSILAFYATASFEEITYATPTGGEIVDLGVDPTGTGDLYTLPKQTDPCGPKVQDGSEYDTCTRDPDGTANTEGSPFVYYTDEPAPYGVQCLPMPNLEPPRPGSFPGVPSRPVAELNVSSCDYTSFCASIQPPNNPPKDQWIWNTLGGPGCALGMWLSSDPNAAPLPDATRCEYGIFRSMALYCEEGGNSSQVAAVNVVTLQGNGSNGQQANVGYPSYLMAPEVLAPWT